MEANIQKCIVIVDDFQISIEIVGEAINQMGHKPILARRPLEALRFFDGRKIDLLITDYNMPEINGLELILKIKENPAYQNLPVIILSGINDPDVIREAQKNQIIWIKKPFKIENFTQIIANLVR